MLKVQICKWKSCKSRFCSYIEDRIKLEKERFNQNIEISDSPCMWNCKNWPTVKINWEKIEKCDPIKVSNLISKKLK